MTDELHVALDGCAIGELITIGGGLGIVTAIGDDVTIARLRRGAAGDVRCTGQLAQVPVGDALIGRTIDPLGAPLDGGDALADAPRRRLAARPLGPCEHASAAGRVRTGIKAVEVCAPLVRGAVVAVCGPDLADVLATCVWAQAGGGARAIVAALGAEPAAVRARLGPAATIVATPPGAPAHLCLLAPQAALAIAEDVRAAGGDALVVIDDLDRLVAALPPATAAERYSVQAALFARAGRRDPTRGGGSITILAARAAPPSPRPSPLDVLFAMDHAWTFASPAPGRLAALVAPAGLSKYAPHGTALPLMPHAAAIRITLAHGQVLRANAIPRELAVEAYLHVERVERLLDQAPAPVPLTTLAALCVAASSRVLHDLAPDDVAAFEDALAAYLADERPQLLAAIDPGRRLDAAVEAGLTEASREVVARLRGN